MACLYCGILVDRPGGSMLESLALDFLLDAQTITSEGKKRRHEEENYLRPSLSERCWRRPQCWSWSQSSTIFDQKQIWVPRWTPCSASGWLEPRQCWPCTLDVRRSSPFFYLLWALHPSHHPCQPNTSQLLKNPHPTGGGRSEHSDGTRLQSRGAWWAR